MYLVHCETLQLVFRNCIFEVARANRIYITFSILEFFFLRSMLYCCCTSQIKLALFAHQRKKSTFCRQIAYCVTTVFAEELLCNLACLAL